MATFSSSSVGADLSIPCQLHMPKFSKFKIGICQLTVTWDKSNNIAKACNSIRVAASQGASLLLLPEMWNCPYSHAHFSEFAEDFNDKDGSPTFSMLSELASCLGVTIIAGSIPERSSNLLYNTCCVFGPDGRLVAKHRKMHMFDINMPGDITFKESDTFTAGEEPTVVDTDFGLLGVGICHDIRFPELAMLYRDRGAHLICYPGAFNMSTGELLWELEQRARATDNQLYVATCSPSRESAGSYMIWGHSTLVGPLGEIIATSGHEETILIAEIDYSASQLARKSLPLDEQRREDVYKFIDLHNKMCKDACKFTGLHEERDKNMCSLNDPRGFILSQDKLICFSHEPCTFSQKIG